MGGIGDAIGGAVKSVGSVLTGGSDKAADKAAGTTQKGIDAQERMFNRSLELLMPYIEAAQPMIDRYVSSAGRPLGGRLGAGAQGGAERGIRGLNTADTRSRGIADQYGGQMESLLQSLANFKPQETEEFAWKQQQLEEDMNRQLAARGKYDSRAGLDTLGDATMQLRSDESDRQWGRLLDRLGGTQSVFGSRFGAERDMFDSGFNKDMQRLGATREFARQNETDQYSKLLDLMKIGQGGAGTAGGWSNSVGNTMAGLYGGLGTTQAKLKLNKYEGIRDSIAGGLSALPKGGLF